MTEKKQSKEKKKDPRMKGKYVYYPYAGEKSSSEKIEASKDGNKR